MKENYYEYRQSIQQNNYEYYMLATPEELEVTYKIWNTSYPRCVASMIRLIADLRNIDTSSWDKFYD